VINTFLAQSTDGGATWSVRQLRLIVDCSAEDLINVTDLPMPVLAYGEGQECKNPVTWNSQSECADRASALAMLSSELALAQAEGPLRDIDSRRVAILAPCPHLAAGPAGHNEPPIRDHHRR
jgi:hypothetical protein